MKGSILTASIVVQLAALAIAWWMTRPAKCPRCGDKHSPNPNQRHPDHATCGRCGCHFNPITGDKS